MSIVRFALKYPYTFYVLAAFILFVGVSEIIVMPEDIFPEIKIPVVSMANSKSVLVKHQLLVLNRCRKRSPNLCPSDRVVAGLCAVFIRPGRLIRSAMVFKPSTLLSLHRALVQRK